MYCKLYQEDIPYKGWSQVKANQGSAGIDEQTIEDVENYGVDRLILEIQEEFKEGKYNPPPVRRVYIPKLMARKDLWAYYQRSRTVLFNLQ